jgi:hypothetical protein
MRTREKQRIFKRFMAGESGASLVTGGWVVSWSQLESILREGLAGKLDGKPKADWLNTGWRGRAQ